jgi:hypothetical protein
MNKLAKLTNKIIYKLKKDKLGQGLIAGAWGTLFIQISSLLSIPLIDPEHTYWDYASFICFGKKVSGANMIVSIFIQIFFCFALAVGITYIRRFLRTKLFLIRGAFLGGAIWFLIESIDFIYQTPVSSHGIIGGVEVAWEFMSAVIFGIIVEFVLEKINKNVITKI